VAAGVWRPRVQPAYGFDQGKPQLRHCRRGRRCAIARACVCVNVVSCECTSDVHVFVRACVNSSPELARLRVRVC
jgi:hypothetical protein